MNAEGLLFPAGLTDRQADLIRKLVVTIEREAPAVYLGEARAHLREVEEEKKRVPEVNLRLANAIYSTFEEVVERWSKLPEHSQPFLCAAMRYFASFHDEVHDFDSFLGFEDDVEVLNSCLELAGLTDFAIDPAHYDEE